MENTKHNQEQELSAQELEDVSGGVYRPDDAEYPAESGSLYNTVANSVSETLSNSGLPYYGDKEKSTYTEEYSKKTYSSPSE